MKPVEKACSERVPVYFALYESYGIFCFRLRFF